MKIKRFLIVLGIVALIGCARGNAKTSSEVKQDTSSSLSSSITEESSISSSTSFTFNFPSFNPGSRSNSPFNTSNETIANKRVIVNLYNPSCGTASTEVLNERLKTYINEIAGTTLVEKIINEKCQIQANIPTKNNSVLIIGSANASGSLEFSFANKIKAVSITAQTYHKPYTDYATGEEMPNIDQNSVCCIEGFKEVIDLIPVNGQPVEKEMNFDLDSYSLRLYSKYPENGRVLIKSMTFVY